MKATDANLLELLRKTNQFVIPIYQRAYSWGEAECRQLWDDVVRAGSTDCASHFTGSIVYVAKGQGTKTAVEPDLIIDGQQRVTTVTLMLAALADHLDALPEDEQEPVDGFAPKKLRGRYLMNRDETDDRRFKLLLSKGDRDALKAVVRSSPLPEVASRIPANFRLIQGLIADDNTDLAAVCRGLNKLVIVDIELSRGDDDPQLIFESMNSTGKKLSQTDLIRNAMLMDLAPEHQNHLYEDYWAPMEQEFAGSGDRLFDEFVRNFLTLKTDATPRLDDVYDAFKAYASAQQLAGQSRDDVVRDLSKYAMWFVAMALGKERHGDLARRFNEIEGLRASVVYPFLLRLYADFAENTLCEADFIAILDAMIAYLVRRSVCKIPTNSLNKTFASLGRAIEPAAYKESVFARLLTLPTYRRFPTDDEFENALEAEDLYNSLRAKYVLSKLENHGRKESVSTDDYTIEHIMPQNENLSSEWQSALGSDWRSVHDRYLHTLGNLTLTGYNPEYSDKFFVEKRDMEGGFAMSPLRLNKGLGELETWNENEITERARRLANEAIAIWERPVLDPQVLATYRAKFGSSDGFDWSTVHAIMAAIPKGRWTSYYYLAEAGGTAAQPLGNHMTACQECSNPHRVLTSEGRASAGFRWHDPTDTRIPTDILEQEGVVVVNGFADPAQQLVTEDLLALIDEIG